MYDSRHQNRNRTGLECQPEQNMSLPRTRQNELAFHPSLQLLKDTGCFDKPTLPERADGPGALDKRCLNL